MDRVWAAQIEVGPPLAAALIDSQFPALAPASIEPLGFGWDNTAFRVNQRYVFRFPRRQIAVGLIATEQRCLPVLARRLPVPIPLPLFAGSASAAYPWPFAGYTFLPGIAAARAGLTLDQRRDLGLALAGFLRALHALPATTDATGAAPFDTFARLDAARRRAATMARLLRLQQAGLIGDATPIIAAIDSAPPPPDAYPPVIVHGDLHAGQVLVDADGRLAGVIDWGDLHLGHPAVDLAMAHQLLPPALHDAFLAAYGAVSQETWALARGRAVWHAVAVMASAADAADRPLMAEMRQALAFVTSR